MAVPMVVSRAGSWVDAMAANLAEMSADAKADSSAGWGSLKAESWDHGMVAMKVGNLVAEKVVLMVVSSDLWLVASTDSQMAVKLVVLKAV